MESLDKKIKASVRLSVSDWFDVAIFIQGDLHNMDSTTDVHKQMTKVNDAILKAVGIAKLKAEQKR